MSAALLRNEVLVSSDDLVSVRHEVASHQAHIKSFAAVMSNGETRELPSELSKIINLAFQALAANGSVTVATLPDELTSNTAAEVLGVSRPTLLKLAKDGKINSFKVGTHSRFKREEVLAFKAEREAARRKALEKLLDIEDQLDQQA
ncbi:helix-turn-helix domain-containing protein [Glutamicibacter creatinolyticus]|uniref:helix-turn-helix domain-containing protein n=1 Tax=Glutamicibacter creatinolyticus TaxID=162496 RepID=UPI0033CA6ED1